MTTIHHSCDTFADALAAYLEQELDAGARAAMDAHAAGCGDCGALLADIAAIRHEAAALPALVPSRDLWTGIAARIETPVVELAVGRERSAVGGRRSALHGWRMQGLAAAALVLVTAGITHMVTRQAMQGGVQGQLVAQAPVVAATGAVASAPAVALAPASESADASASQVAVAGSDQARELASRTADRASSDRSSADRRPPIADRAVPANRQPPTANAQFVSYRPGQLAALDSLYDREIVRLRRILGERRGMLDSTTVQVLDRNMLVIDRAIRECRAALARDPASTYLNEQLNEALESKIELLRAAAMSPVGE